MNKKKLALSGEILRGVVGSTAHGTAIEGQDDRDEMGVCIEPPEYVCGLRKFEQYIYRTKPEGVRSGPGDLDLVIYSLRKFCHLAVRGNPSIVLLLWLPEYITKTEWGDRLLGLRDTFIHREAGKRFLGYLVSQKRILKGERNKKVSRPELVERYGYDTKFAMHALRLGLQGIEYLRDGRLTVPVEEPDLSMLRDVRLGKLTLQQTLTAIEDAEDRLQSEIDVCDREADTETVNRFLIAAHWAHWRVRNEPYIDIPISEPYVSGLIGGKQLWQ